MRSVGFGIGWWLVGGCGPSTDDLCGADLTSVQVHVVDEDRVDIADATAVYAVDGGEPEDCEGPWNGLFNCAWNRPGAFTVTAEAPGYAAESASVTVEPRGCTVATEELELVLGP